MGPAATRARAQHLLANATKYSPDGGAITVAVNRDEVSGTPWAVVSVRDEGIGVPSSALPRIFDRFYRAENTAGFDGNGLGLSGVLEVVQAHGGAVRVESVEGEGSTFTLRLPLDPAFVEVDDSTIGAVDGSDARPSDGCDQPEGAAGRGQQKSPPAPVPLQP